MALDIANIRKEIAAASALVGVDLLQVSPSHPDARTPFARKMDSIACVGSAAAGDFIFDLFINGRRVGTYANSATGVGIDKSRDLIALDLFVPANALIECKVVDAANTNPVLIQLEFSKPDRVGGFRRRTYRRYGSARTSGLTTGRRSSTGMY